MNFKIDLQIFKFNIALFLRAILLLSPVMLLFYQENGLTVQDLFFFQGIFYLTSILAEVPTGYLSDNISRKKLLVLSFAVFFFICVMWLFFHGYYIILAGEILFGISKVMMDNAMSGYLYDYLDLNNANSKMVKYYGYLNFFLALGTAVAAIWGTWMFARLGSHKILLTEILLISVSIALVLSLPEIKPSNPLQINFPDKMKSFFTATGEIYNNINIKYYILYSGILTSFSILFALSFQPLMQNAMFPIFLFGVVAFLNHGIRALAGIAAGKCFRNVNIKKLVLPVFFLYIIAFTCIFESLRLKNIYLITFLLFVICIIIGIQLIFTIVHISRLHRFVSISNRGSLMSVNNLVSRVLAVIVLISSKFFISKFGLKFFFFTAFVVYLTVCSYLTTKICKENV